jgi:hypothetical protein
MSDIKKDEIEDDHLERGLQLTMSSSLQGAPLSSRFHNGQG